MSLEYKEFQILETLEAGGLDASLTQRELAERTGMSVGSVNAVVADLTERGLMAEGSLTKGGLPRWSLIG